MGENNEKYLRIERQEEASLEKEEVEELTNIWEALINLRREVHNQILGVKQKIDSSSETYKKIQVETKGWPNEIPTADLMSLLEEANKEWQNKVKKTQHLKMTAPVIRYRGKKLSNKLLAKIKGQEGEELEKFINQLSQPEFISKNFNSNPLDLFLQINRMEAVVGKLINPYRFNSRRK